MRLVQDALFATARRTPDAPALVAADGVTTFAELDHASDAIARGLQELGIVRGDRVMIVLENSIELVMTVFGVLKAGGVFVVVNPTTKAEKLAYLLDDSGARAVVASELLATGVVDGINESAQTPVTIWVGDVPASASDGVALATLRAHRSEPPAVDLIDVDLAAIIYTSGSTGAPKGVMLTHRNICHNAWSISTYLDLQAEDVVACLLPLSFNYGLFQIFTSMHVGFSVLLERSFAYPFDVMRRLAEYRVTVLPGVPTVFATILGMPSIAELDLSAVRIVTNAAAALPPAHIARLRALFPMARIFSMYGLTECSRVSFLDPDRLDQKMASVGQAMPNTEAYVVDEHGKRVPPGTVGELVVRGANVMRGYWRKPEETAVALREGEIPGELVLHTGDRFWADDDGDLYFVGRQDELFKCKGETVSPKEIELVLYEMAEIAEAAVVPVPDDIEGMAIKAVVALREGCAVDERAIRQHCRGRLESHLVPKVVEVRASLPKTESGKIAKASLS